VRQLAAALFSRELARARLGLERSARPASRPVRKRQQAAALQSASTYYPSLSSSSCQETRCPLRSIAGGLSSPFLCDNIFLDQIIGAATTQQRDRTANTISVTSKIRLKVCSMSLEAWKTLFEITGVVLLFLTFLSGAGVLFTSTRINERQAEKLKQFDSDLTAAKFALSVQEERAANLEKEAAALLKQLIDQGPRSHLLYGERQERLIEQLKPFTGQKIEVRFCRASFNQFFIDNDTMGVVMRLQDILRKSLWSVIPFVIDNCGGNGIEVSVNPKAPDTVRKAADALWLALHEVPLAMVGDKPFVMESPRPEQPKTIDCGTTSNCENKEVTFPPLGHDTIVLTVLAHP